VCKFYQGSEDKALEMKLKQLFWKVHREKPESSRSVSKPPTEDAQPKMTDT
jgi:21S rRNA (uridine2791-2'-O)-methyltransferase